MRTRRALLGGGLGAVAALVANAFGKALPVRAANGDVVHVGGYHTGTNTTSFTTSLASPYSTFSSVNEGTGTGLSAVSGSGNGLYASSTGGNALSAYTVYGYGVRANSQENYGVWGSSDKNYGVYGTSTASYAVIGASNSSIGVFGLSETGTGVHGSTGGTGAGVAGISSGGRGGVFQGKKAQVRLVPSTAATHPSSGVIGDLFVDAAKRLWFCKGGTSWVRLDD